MFKILGSIPKTHFHLACSGGTDSMTMMSFLMKYPRNKFDVIHFDHGTECCVEAREFITDFCNRHGIECHVGRISRERKNGESREEYWRNERYAFFKKFSDEKIITTHHLNDCIETWIMTSMRGIPQLIPYNNPKYNIIRPFLTVPKSEINDWIKRNKVEYVYDRSNSDTGLTRNYVRHVMMEHVLHLNPGIEKTISKMILEKYRKDTEIIK